PDLRDGLPGGGAAARADARPRRGVRGAHHPARGPRLRLSAPAPAHPHPSAHRPGSPPPERAPARLTPTRARTGGGGVEAAHRPSPHLTDPGAGSPPNPTDPAGAHSPPDPQGFE